MCEIERYLDQIRSSLDVSPPRADEITAEVRGHLEARARDYESQRMSREQAAAEAVRSFGEPAKVAAELGRANARHRTGGLFRVLLGIAVAFGVSVSLGALLGAPGWRDPAVIHFLTTQMRLDEMTTVWLILMVGGIPGALLSGLAAGRRHWWVAVTPPLFFIALTWVMSLVCSQLPYGPVASQLLHALVWPLLVAAVFAAGGRLGARLAERPLLGRVVGALCAAYGLSLCVPAFLLAVGQLEGLVLAVAIAQGAACIFLLAAYREQLVGQLVLIVGGAALTGTVAAALILLLTGTIVDPSSSEVRVALLLSLALVVLMPTTLVWHAARQRRLTTG